jgi:hypothetical protein
MNLGQPALKHTTKHTPTHLHRAPTQGLGSTQRQTVEHEPRPTSTQTHNQTHTNPLTQSSHPRAGEHTETDSRPEKKCPGEEEESIQTQVLLGVLVSTTMALPMLSQGILIEHKNHP